MGDMEECVTYLQRNLELREVLLGSEHPELGSDVMNLGLALMDVAECQEALDQAIAMVQRAVKLFEQVGCRV